MKEFLKKHGVRLGILVIVVVLIVVLATGTGNGSAGFLTNAVGAAREPVQRAAASVSDWLSGLYGYLYEYDSLKAENESLRIQLADAQEQVRTAQEYTDENARLRELLNLSQAHTDYVFESSKIVSWSSSNWESTFTISKGSSSGIEVGDAVITEYNALVGIITEVGDSWATVRTVIDIETGIGCLVGSDSSAGMIVGDYSMMRQGQVKLTYMTEGAQMFIDDTVLTSGRGGTIPQGVTIGTVTKILSEAGGQTEYGVVTPACDFSTLVQVFVIKEFNVVE